MVSHHQELSLFWPKQKIYFSIVEREGFVFKRGTKKILLPKKIPKVTLKLCTIIINILLVKLILISNFILSH